MKILESYKKMMHEFIKEEDDDKYSHIGYGKYKLKGKEDDENADVFTKDDKGRYVKSAADSKGDSEKDAGGKLGGGDFDRDANRAADDEADDMDRDARFAADAPDQDEFRFKSDHKYPLWWEDEDPEDWSDEDFDAAVDELEKIQNPSEDEKWAEKAKLKKMDDDEREEYLNRKQDHVRGLQSKIADAEKAAHKKQFPDQYEDEPEDPIGAAGDVPVGELPDRSDGDYDEDEMQFARDELQWAKDDLEFAQEEGDEEGIAKAKEAIKKAHKAIDKLRGESITFNGKRYKPIRESKTHILKENYERFFGDKK